MFAGRVDQRATRRVGLLISSNRLMDQMPGAVNAHSNEWPRLQAAHEIVNACRQARTSRSLTLSAEP